MAPIDVRDFKASDESPLKKPKVEEEKMTMGNKAEVKDEEMENKAEVEEGKMGNNVEVKEEEMESDFATEEEIDTSDYDSDISVDEEYAYLFSKDLEVRFKDIADEEIRKKLIHYHEKLRADGPYEIDCLPHYPMISPVVPLSLDYPDGQQLLERANKSAQFAVDKYNRVKKTKFQLDCLKKATYQCTCGRLFYLTLVVIDSGEKKTYRAQVLDDTINKKMSMFECYPVKVATAT